MIKIEHVITPSELEMNFIIEGMRNPMNSWDDSDSALIFNDEGYADSPAFELGEKDFSLMKKLAYAGPDERKFMRMMVVYARITAPLYWWKEFDTYKVGTVANSCSTMHKIHEKEFTLSDFSTDHLDVTGIYILQDVIEALNIARYRFNNYDDLSDTFKVAHTSKDLWWQMIQLLPTSYNQTRNVMLNYEVLATMYHARKHHRLDEWKDFCEWIMSLPYKEIIL